MTDRLGFRACDFSGCVNKSNILGGYNASVLLQTSFYFSSVDDELSFLKKEVVSGSPRGLLKFLTIILAMVSSHQKGFSLSLETSCEMFASFLFLENDPVVFLKCHSPHFKVVCQQF